MSTPVSTDAPAAEEVAATEQVEEQTAAPAEPEGDAQHDEAAPTDSGIVDDLAGSQSPADVDDGAVDKAIELHSAKGALSLLPGQRDLDGRQAAALAAIGIDTRTDPGVAVHIRPFMHMCQVRGLDPYAREAYLIGRGKGDNRKYTMQVGIDGYLKIAKSTGQYKRIAGIYWTGRDDDPKSWREVTNARGMTIMSRVWWDQWPAERGEPGAAMVVVEHYDDYGVLTETDAIADWGMYAPYNDAWVPDPKGGTNQWGKPKTIKKIGEDGKPEQELSAMWAKGAAHMLAKCAIALAMRRAFPAKMSGMYLHEEMHQADAMERRRAEAESTEARIAYVQSRRAANEPDVPTADGVESVLASPSVPDAPHIIDGEVIGEEHGGPTRVGEVIAAAQATMRGVDKPEPEPTPAAPDADEDTQRGWLLEELAMMADVTGSSPAGLARRWVARAKKNVDQFTRAELLPMVTALRPTVVAKLRQDGRVVEADAYEQAHDVKAVGPVGWLLGHDLVAAGK